MGRRLRDEVFRDERGLCWPIDSRTGPIPQAASRGASGLDKRLDGIRFSPLYAPAPLSILPAPRPKRPRARAQERGPGGDRFPGRRDRRATAIFGGNRISGRFNPGGR